VTWAAHAAAALLYLLAAGLGWAGRRGHPSARGVPWALALGVALHVLGFIGFHREVPPVALESGAAGLSLIGWLIASSYLLSLGLTRSGAVGGWVAASAFAFTTAALAEFALVGAGPMPGRGGAWSHAHVLLAAAGFGVLAVSSVAGLGYLLKERELKHKQGARVELPSLESLDRLGSFTLSIGFPLLTLGVVTGFVWLSDQGGSVWSRHVVLSLVAWAVYCVPVASRLVQGQRGHSSARAVVVGFLVLAISYLGSRILEGVM
jgi:ABC-type uncharacterized transport system permease subunit